MAEVGETNGMPTSLQGTENKSEPEEIDEPFVTEGSQALKQARLWIAKYSLEK